MHVLSREEMMKYDSYTIDELGIPGENLMEKAGRGCSERIKSLLTADNSRIAVFCGSGNNGGDGFVIARYLRQWKHEPTIFLTGDKNRMSPETKGNYQKCLSEGTDIIKLINISSLQNSPVALSEYDLIIDAIFGVGLKGNLRGWIRELVKSINDSGVKVVSVDIPSGIDANSGNGEIAVKADLTLTMANYKYGHFLGRGRECSGEIEIIDIGIPGEVYTKFPPRAYVAADENVVYPARNRFHHKGNYGRIGIIAGSPGYSGAAVMACRAALRAGGGLITLFHRQGMAQIFETQLLEVMTSEISENIDREPDFKQLFTDLDRMDVLLIGPGMGTDQYAAILLEKVLEHFDGPVVLDADALNMISSKPELFSLIENRLLLPHIGEFARLTGSRIKDINADPVGNIDEFISQYHCSVLLKSSTSLYADKDNLAFNVTGNDGLATGGSGDVLAGIVVSFLGQGCNYRDAALTASFLLGRTAEQVALIRKPASIIPSDLIDNLFKY